MKIYGIYDLKNKEQCLRIGDIREIANFLNITARRLDMAIRGYRKSSEVSTPYFTSVSRALDKMLFKMKVHSAGCLQGSYMIRLITEKLTASKKLQR